MPQSYSLLSLTTGVARTERSEPPGLHVGGKSTVSVLFRGQLFAKMVLPSRATHPHHLKAREVDLN